MLQLITNATLAEGRLQLRLAERHNVLGVLLDGNGGANVKYARAALVRALDAQREADGQNFETSNLHG